MKAYFDGDKNVLVFKPIDTKQWRKNGLTNEERLKSMNTSELAHELALIATWDRKQLDKAQKGPGVEEFMEIWLRKPSQGE